MEPKKTVCTLSFIVHGDLQAAANSKVPSLLRMGIEEGLSHRQSTHPKGLAIVLAVERHPEVDIIQTQAMFELLS
jgi:hypothetical protein